MYYLIQFGLKSGADLDAMNRGGGHAILVRKILHVLLYM